MEEFKWFKMDSSANKSNEKTKTNNVLNLLASIAPAAEASVPRGFIVVLK